MESRGESNDVNASNWDDQKQPSFPSLSYSDNTNWETASMLTSVAKEAIKIQWVWSNPHRIVPNKRNCLKKMGPDVAECSRQSIQEYFQKNHKWEGTEFPMVANM